VIASRIVTAFFAPGVSFVMTGEPASEEIAGKPNVDSLVVSHWQISAELFQTRRFSGFYGFTASVAHKKDQNSPFPVARCGNVSTIHKFLRLTAWASPRAFASKTRPDGHAVKQVVCENLCMGAYYLGVLRDVVSVVMEFRHRQQWQTMDNRIV